MFTADSTLTLHLERRVDPGVTVKQLVCQRLPIEDLRSVRLATQEWCRAASSSVSTAVVAAQAVRSPVAERVLAAFPCCTHIVIVPLEHARPADSSTSNVMPWQQFCTAPAAAGQPQHKHSWLAWPFALLLRDTPQRQPGQGWQPDCWSLLVKAAAGGGSDFVRMAPHLPPICKLVGLLADRSARVRVSTLLSIGRTSLRCLRLDVTPLETWYTPQLSQLLSLPLQCLRQLQLNCNEARPLRLDAQADLQHLSGLETLQLSGNILLVSPHSLNTPHLISLTLQQTLTDTQLLQLLHKQQRLQHLAVHVAEPQGVQNCSDYSSSCRAVQGLQARMEVCSLQPGSGALVHLDVPRSTLQPLRQVTPALINVLTPRRLADAESIALSFMPQSSRAPLPHGAHAAASHGWATVPLPAAAAPAGAHKQVAAGRPYTSAGLEHQRRLQQLVVSCGCWVDLRPLLQQVCPAELLVHTLPAATDHLLRTAMSGQSGRLNAGRAQWVDLWRHIGAAALSGAVPGALRLQLPVGCALSVLVVDTSNTAAGVEVDDRTLLAISSSCRHLQHLSITGLLRFTGGGGAALQTLMELKQLTLCDTSPGAVQHLLALAAVSPRRRWWIQEVARELRCQYYVVAAGAHLIAAALRKHRLLRIGAQLGLAAVALRPTVESVRELLPAWEVQPALLCAAAMKLAGRAPQLLRPCWLPPELQLLQLGGCVLRPHHAHHCPACNSRLAAAPQLQLQELSVTVDGNFGGVSAGSPRPPAASRHSLKDLAKREIRAGRRRRLYPSLFELARRVVLAPIVPFAVTTIASATIRCVWGALCNAALLRDNRQRALTEQQVLEFMVAFAMGI